MTEPTMKDTKATILDAYKEVVVKLKEKTAGTMNPSAIKENVRKSEVMKSATNALDESVLDSLSDTLKVFTLDMIDRIAKFNDLNEAIQVKEGELKELFDIEKEAFTLAALVDSHNEIKDNFNAEMSKKKADLTIQLQNIIQSIEDMKNANEIERKREEEVYNYNFERNKQSKLDALNDSIATSRKNNSMFLEGEIEKNERRIKELDIREAAILENEDSIKELKEKVAEIPTLIAEAVKAKVGKAEGMLKSAFETEKKFMIIASESAKAVSDAKVDEMNKTISALNATVLSLQTKLDSAYGEIKTMAIATVEGAGNTKMFQEMKEVMGNAKKNA